MCPFLVFSGKPKNVRSRIKHRRPKWPTKPSSAEIARRNSFSPKVNRNSTERRDFKMSPSAALNAAKPKRQNSIVTDFKDAKIN